MNSQQISSSHSMKLCLAHLKMLGWKQSHGHGHIQLFKHIKAHDTIQFLPRTEYWSYHNLKFKDLCDQLNRIYVSC